jgi:hypothetical protein
MAAAAVMINAAKNIPVSSFLHARLVILVMPVRIEGSTILQDGNSTRGRRFSSLEGLRDLGCWLAGRPQLN